MTFTQTLLLTYLLIFINEKNLLGFDAVVLAVTYDAPQNPLS